MKHFQILAFILFSGITLSAQQLFIHTISEATGLKSDIVFDIAEDKNGYIWICTLEGIIRYDGVNLQDFTIENGWPTESNFNKIHIDNNNVLWVCCQDTNLFLVNKINHQKQEIFSIADTKGTTCIFQEKENMIWMGCKSEIRLYDHYRLSYKKNIGSHVDEITRFKEKVWVATKDSGVAVVDITTGNIKYINEEVGLPSNKCNYITCINQKIYVGHEFGFTIVDPENRSFVAHHLTGFDIHCIHPDEQNRIWASGVDEISIYQNNTRTYHFSSKNNDFIGAEFTKTLIDHEGNIWFSSNGGGIGRIISLNLLRYSLGIKENEPVYGISQSNDSTYWLSYYSTGFLSRMNLNKHIPKFDTISCPQVLATFSEKNPYTNEIYVAGFNGLALIKNNAISTYTPPEFNNQQLWRPFFNSSDSSLYITSIVGLYKMQNGVYTKIEHNQPDLNTNDNYIYKVQGDRDNLIVATANGLKRIINGKLHDLPEIDRLLGYDKMIFSLAMDQYKQFWCDIKRDRILKFRIVGDRINYQVYNLYKMFGLKGPYNFHVQENKMWFRTTKKLYQLDIEKLNRNVIVIENTLDIHDGIKPESPYFTTYFSDTKSYLWIMGNYGAIRYDYKSFKKNNTETLNSVRRILINQKPVDLKVYSSGIENKTNMPAGLRLPNHMNEITFEYVGICHKSQEEVLYRTRLIGYRTEWSEPSSENHITYNNLSPGTYTFQLISCNNDRLWNKEPYSFTFTILPAWYQTWWFKLVIAIFIAGIVYFLFLLRINKLKKDKLKQEKLTQDILQSQEQERKRIAQELHDGVGQELSMLKVNVEKLQHPEVTGKVSKIIEDIRFLSRNIHPHYFEKLGLTRAVEMIIDENNKLEKTFWVHELENVDHHFNTNQQLMLYRVIQECINNTTKHSGSKNAKVSITDGEKEITIVIQDNGVGFAVDQLKLNSLGLSTIRERIKSLNGSILIKSTPGKGTATEIILPHSIKKNKG